MSEILVNDLPDTLGALTAGEISYRHAQTMVDHTTGLDAETRATLETARCEIDHTQDWRNDGQTRHDNLAHLCKSHHILKHKTEWDVAQARDGTGTLTWTSPAGRDYVTEPEIHMRA